MAKLVKTPRLRNDIVITPSQVEEGQYYLQDPIVDRFYEANFFQYEILIRLDGSHTVNQIARTLSEKFDVEIAGSDVEEYVATLHRFQLLDLAGMDIHGEELRREAARVARKALIRQGFSLEDKPSRKRRRTRERALFSQALRALYADDVIRSLSLFGVILELNPSNERAQIFRTAIQTAVVRTRAKFGRQSRLTENVRVGYFNPDRFLGWLDRRIGRFVFTWWFASLCILAYGIGFEILIANWDQMITEFVDHPARNISLFYCVNVVYAFFHEMSHGLACKHYGGKVPEIGFLLVMGMPAAYCNVSESYLFPTKARIVTLLAGLAASQVVWGTLMIVWRITEQDTVAHIFSTACGPTLGYVALINLLPVQKMDGYFIFAELMRLPNMFDDAKAYWRALVVRLLVGNWTIPTPPPRQRHLYFWYYPLPVAFRFFYYYVWIFLIGGWLIDRYRGMAFSILALFFGRLALKWLVGFGAEVRQGYRISPARTLRPLRLFLLIAFPAVLLSGVFLVNWTRKQKAVVWIEAQPLARIRTPYAGQVSQVAVREGQYVAAGQLVARLDTTAADFRLAWLSGDLQRAEANLRLLVSGPRPEEVAAMRSVMAQSSVRVHHAAIHNRRARALTSSGAISGAAADQIQRELASSAGALEVARARLRLLQAAARPEEIAALRADLSRLNTKKAAVEAELAAASLRSPIAGQVLTRNVEQLFGRHLSPGDLVVEIANTHTLNAVMLIDADGIEGIQIGSAVEMRFWAFPDRLFRCRLSRLSDKPLTQSSSSVRDTDFPLRIRGDESLFEARCLLGQFSSHRSLRHHSTGVAKVFVERVRLIDLVLRPASKVLSVDFWSLW